MPLINTKKNHIKSLTGLRFFAALLVMLMHFSEYMKFPDISLPIIKAGGIGVSFFFVLSGFLLYLRYGFIFENKINKQDIKNFYLARFFRIYPAYFLGLILITIIHFITFKHFKSNPSFENASLSGWIANFLALQTFSSNLFTQQFWNAPSWSVSTEFFFYISFPFFLFFFTRKVETRFNIIIAILLFLTVWVILRLLVVFGSFAGWFDRNLWVDYISDRNFFWRFWEFGIGVFSGKFFLTQKIQWTETKSGRNILLLSCILIILSIAYMPWPADPMSHLLMRVLRLAILNTLPFAIIITIFCTGRNFLSSTMENKFVIYLGECSFAIYIYHWSFWTILESTQRLGYSISNTMVLACMAGTTLFSMASYSFYENPLQKWATRNFIRRSISFTPISDTPVGPMRSASKK